MVTLRCTSLRVGGQRCLLGFRVLVETSRELTAFDLFLKSARLVIGDARHDCFLFHVIAVGKGIFESCDTSL